MYASFPVRSSKYELPGAIPCSAGQVPVQMDELSSCLPQRHAAFHDLEMPLRRQRERVHVARVEIVGPEAVAHEDDGALGRAFEQERGGADDERAARESRHGA